MEKVLRNCCRSIRIGKILIRRDQDTKKPRVQRRQLSRQLSVLCSMKFNVLSVYLSGLLRQVSTPDREEKGATASASAG